MPNSNCVCFGSQFCTKWGPWSNFYCIQYLARKPQITKTVGIKLLIWSRVAHTSNGPHSRKSSVESWRNWHELLREIVACISNKAAPRVCAWVSVNCACVRAWDEHFRWSPVSCCVSTAASAQISSNHSLIHPLFCSILTLPTYLPTVLCLTRHASCLVWHNAIVVEQLAGMYTEYCTTEIYIYNRSTTLRLRSLFAFNECLISTFIFLS